MFGLKLKKKQMFLLNVLRLISSYARQLLTSITLNVICKKFGGFFNFKPKWKPTNRFRRLDVQGNSTESKLLFPWDFLD